MASLSDAHPRADRFPSDGFAYPRPRVWRFRLGVAVLMALALAAVYGWTRLYQWVNYRDAPLVART